MPKTFSTKTVSIAITLNNGVFASGGNAKIIEGLACDVSVDKPTLPEKNSAKVNIWGLSYHDMAQLTMLGFKPLESRHNLISIKAGERGKALSLVFHGEITSAYAAFNAAPDPCMRFSSESGVYPEQIASPTVTFKGDTPAEALFERFAREAGYTFKNEGLSAWVSNVWFSGSPVEKMEKLAHDIGCRLFIDDGMVIVLPEGKPRQGGVVLLSEKTGLIGYPTFGENGISCKSLFNPSLKHGGLIKVESIVPRASGVWCISKLCHDLSAYKSGGMWQSLIDASPV